MTRMKNRPLLKVCLLFGILMFCISAANAVSRTIYVEAEQEVVEDVDLKVDDEVSGRISVVGEFSDDKIDFQIIDPDGKAVVPDERVSVKDFRFTASREGTYRIHFNNFFSTERKTVAFNYDVRHYIFGIPQEDFLVYMIMIVAVIGLLLFGAMSRP